MDAHNFSQEYQEPDYAPDEVVQTSSYKFRGLELTLRTDGHSISDILQAVEYTLRGQGYSFTGHIELVSDESMGDK